MTLKALPSVINIFEEVLNVKFRVMSSIFPLVLQVHQLSPPTVLLRSLHQHLTYYPRELKTVLNCSPDLGPIGPTSLSIVSTDSLFTFTTSTFDALSTRA
jgi:hypothetical protein